MRFSTVSQWLNWILSVHHTEIELGLDRVKAVALRLGLFAPACPVIIVGGTNGKGSTVASLEAIYYTAGYHVGAFTSPILFKHNEQVRIDKKQATDEQFCWAFCRIERARSDISLTPFEFFTLAALLIFNEYPLDILILEVGLGGRLDAVNIVDASVAVITNIDLDHMDRLGMTREAIGYEKAGIFRKDTPVVCGDEDPPQSLIEQAAIYNAPFFCLGRDFFYEEDINKWSWTYQTTFKDLPTNSLFLQNLSCSLMAISLLQERIPVSHLAINRGLREIDLPGRIQVLLGPITEIYDVSHNPAAIKLLARRLKTLPCPGKTYAIFSMLADKDIQASIACIDHAIDEWYVAALSVNRAATQALLANAFVGQNNVNFLTTIEEAFFVAKQNAKIGDRMIIFGSFHTVATVWRCRALT